MVVVAVLVANSNHVTLGHFPILCHSYPCFRRGKLVSEKSGSRNLLPATPLDSRGAAPPLARE